MYKFSDIESLRNVNSYVKRYHEYGQYPTVEYRGTVKLHGSNGAFRRDATSAEIIPQSRQNELSLLKDNARFAAFIKQNEDLCRDLTQIVYLIDIQGYYQTEDFSITVFGEWCGGNIQNSGDIALRQVPKHFVIFDTLISFNDTSIDSFHSKTLLGFITDHKRFNDRGIYFINQIPSYDIVIDFNRLEDYTEQLEKWTLEIEDECPWCKTMFGVSGVGEGCVLVPIYPPFANNTNFWFKSKGLKHKGNDKTKGAKHLSIDPIRANSIREVIEEVLPEWRLEQGVSEIKQHGLDVIPQNMGEYLRWIANDIVKEHADTLAANNLVWKDVASSVTSVARNYFLNLTKL